MGGRVLTDWRVSGWTGGGQNGIVRVRVYKKIDMCVNLEWVAGCRRTGHGLDGLARVWMDW